MKLVSFLLLWAFIALVSAYDTYVNIRHPVTAHTELNPVAKCILENSNNDLALLIAVKMVGTSIVLGVLLAGYFYRSTHAYCVAVSLALVQFGVLMFLQYG